MTDRPRCARLPPKAPAQQSFTFYSQGIIFIAAGIWIALWMFYLRYHFLDDAFIHLRYAHNLLRYHHIGYNKGFSDFGCSSLGYLLLLAAGSVFTSDPMLLKVVNIAAYGSLIVLVAFALKNSSGLKRSLIAASSVILLSPFAFRWLTDGMETGIVVILGIVVAFASSRGDCKPRCIFGIGFLAVMFRVEFLFVLLLASVGRYFVRDDSVGPTRPLIRRIMLSAAPIVGGLLAAAVIYFIFGKILPDTAVAKEPMHPLDHPFATFHAIAAAHASSSIFGAGSFLLLMLTLWAALRRARHSDALPLIVVNSGYVVFLGLIVITGQSLQGIRYFLFIYSFLITWNISFIPSDGFRIPRWTVPFIASAVALWFAGDAYLMTRVVPGRSQTYRTFAKNNLKPILSNQQGLAWDIGFIGYFGDALLWDANGLVNGRRFARLPADARLTEIAKQPLSYIFGNANQLSEFNDLMPIVQWVCVLHADFPNASGTMDRHWLLIRQDLQTRMSAERRAWDANRCPFAN